MSSSEDNKSVHAKYHAWSEFIIPKDVTDYYIIWDRLCYKDKDGNEIEVVPVQSFEEDIEMSKRPRVINDTEIHKEVLFDKPVSEFIHYMRNKDKDQLIDMLWRCLTLKERFDDLKRAKEDSDQNVYDDADEDEPDDYPSAYLSWIDGLSSKDIVRSMWMRMSVKERRELIDESKEAESESEDEFECGCCKTTRPVTDQTGICENDCGAENICRFCAVFDGDRCICSDCADNAEKSSSESESEGDGQN